MNKFANRKCEKSSDECLTLRELDLLTDFCFYNGSLKIFRARRKLAKTNKMMCGSSQLFGLGAAAASPFFVAFVIISKAFSSSLSSVLLFDALSWLNFSAFC